MAGQERTVAQLALAALFGPRKGAAEPDAVSVAASAGPELLAPVPLMRFLTVGHAVVEVHAHRFTTRYTRQGRPYADPANPPGGRRVPVEVRRLRRHRRDRRIQRPPL
ncbi:hypothetical protein [Streptomyces sp. NRRL F-2747]|uniref:hypothetical protein n=1 Tax=Streptomyces sp. NRRL F-2747 TaxID=1463843 RepID=UPI0004CA7F71|nr:hypothetical protein [Streptomyces sp. NRRL F-2747]